jgi:Double-GTPase 2
MWFVYLVITVVGAALVAAATALYISYAIAAVVLAAAAAITTYGLGLPIAYLAGLGKVLVARPADLSRPDTWPQPPEGTDPAVLQYFYGPAKADAVHGTAVAYRRCQALWSRGCQAVSWSMRTELLPASVPLGIGGAVGMAMGVAAGTVIAAGCALVHVLNVGLCTAAVRVTGAVLRGADSGLLRIKNIHMVCRNRDCAEPVTYPGYACPNPTCPRQHRDVRPGRLGIIRRYCRCGTRMSTLLLFGSARMSAFCPRCGHSLEYRPGEAPEIVLPFFGVTGAGKTQLLAAIVTQLRAWAAAERLTVEPGDPATARGMAEAEELLKSAPAPGQLSSSLVVRVSSGRVTRILHMFDAPGGSFLDVEQTGELRYLAAARTFILVIDPLSVEAFRDRLVASGRADLAGTYGSGPPPDQAYHHTYQQIEEMGVRLREARLAVAFSRADLLDLPDGDVAEWARCELGLSNLIISARQYFKDVEFHRTSAVPVAGGAVHESVAALLSWLLAGSRLTLPGGKRR